MMIYQFLFKKIFLGKSKYITGFLLIHYGDKIKNIYIYNKLFLNASKKNIYYKFKETGEFEFQFKSIDGYQENQKIIENYYDCGFNFLYSEIIYIYSSISHYFFHFLNFKNTFIE